MTKIKLFLECTLFFLIAIGMQQVCFYAYNYIAYVYVAGIEYATIVDLGLKAQTVDYINSTEIIYIVSGWLITLGVIMFIMNITKEHIMDFTGHGLSIVNIVLAMVMGIGLVLATMALVNLMAEFFDNSYEVKEVLYFDHVIWTFFSVGLLIPILEELFFRGLLLNRLSKMKAPFFAIFLQALFFSVSHMDLKQGAYLFVLGIVAGLVVYKTKSVISAIIIHMVFNVMNMYMNMYVNASYQVGQLILMFLLGIVLVAFGLGQTHVRKLKVKQLEPPIKLY